MGGGQASVEQCSGLRRPVGGSSALSARGSLKIAAIKAPGFGERKTQYLDDIAILTGATVIRDEVGLSLDKADKSVLGTAAKVVLMKESTTIVGDGSTQEEVTKRVAQIKNLIEAAEQECEKEKLNERIAKLAGGVAVIQVGAQTETELKEITHHLFE
ncbi:Chaperonin 60 subunit beta 2 chloroplastic [Zea mays]|uniref:Chaperonin 60 subunit beta 2 chloroplastic n=1 Tax=Zea mays TaxID=4577 RepID=A0A1D6QNK1_MAIZE|nr:Chaperonin 60 subunit beta 2 chloroplastic [Zea mays]